MTYLDEWIDTVGRQAGDYARCLAEHGQVCAPPEPENFGRWIKHRLARGAAEYGNSFRKRPLEELFAEIVQEPPDTAAWGALISMVLGLEHHTAQNHLIRAAALSALAMQELAAAREAAVGD